MPDGHPPGGEILDGVRERFDASTDFTVGIEEEYQILDPATLALTNRFEDMVEAADEPLRGAPRRRADRERDRVPHRRQHVAFADAARDLVEGRLATLALADRLGLALGITGVHPFSPWTEQRIIDTPHYRRVEEELGYIAWTNNTWSLHLHAGVHGRRPRRGDLDRDAQRPARAARPVGQQRDLRRPRHPAALDADPGVHQELSALRHPRRLRRTGTSTPRFVELLERTGSIVESTQIWWSVRPAPRFGTVEVRICDGQTEMSEALAVAALTLACIAAFAAERRRRRRRSRPTRAG